MIAFSTSPGLEMFERSIFVLMPSGSVRAAREDFAAAPSPVPRSLTRTLSASFSSRELECVFFSVTPTSVNTSRIALLLTSSSRARSLIRTLLIRLFVLLKSVASGQWSVASKTNCSGSLLIPLALLLVQLQLLQLLLVTRVLALRLRHRDRRLRPRLPAHPPRR